MKNHARVFSILLILAGSAVGQTVFTSSTTLNTNGQALGAVTINPGVTVNGNAGVTVTAEASEVLGTLLAPTGFTYNAAGYNMDVGRTVGSTGTLSLSGGNVTTNAVIAGHDGGTGTVNLNGGTLTTTTIERWTGGSTLNFAGGTLRAAADHPALINGYTLGALITTGAGAIIDTNGFNVGINSTFSGAGGLTKSGTGTLTLTSSSINSGATSVLAGSLVIAGGAISHPTSDLKVENPSGASFTLNGGSVSVDSSYIGFDSYLSGSGTLNSGTWNNASGMHLGYSIHSSGTFTLNGGTLVAPQVSLGRFEGTGTLQLNGGVLETSSIGRYSLASSLAVNGATLRAGSDTTGLLNGFTSGSAVLQAGGLTIDTSNFTVASPGVLTGSGGLTKTGAGVLTLLGSSTYTGSTTVTAGTLRFGVSQPLSSGIVEVAGGAVLDLNGWSVSLNTLSGAGNVILGTTGADLTVGFETVSKTFAGGISGAGNFIKTGSGSLTLTGSSTNDGYTDVRSGSLVLDGGSIIHPTTFLKIQGLSEASLIVNGGSVSVNTSYIGINYGFSGSATLNSGTWNDASSVEVAHFANSTGTLTLNGGTMSTPQVMLGRSGGTALVRLNGGVLETSAVICNSVSSSLTADGGTLRVRSATSGLLTGFPSGSVLLQSGGLTIDTNTFNTDLSADLTGGGGLGKTGAGILRVSGVNTYTGSTTITAGTLQTNAANALPAGTQVSISTGSTLDLAGFSATIGSLSGGGNVALGAGSLTAGTSDASTVFSGIISGSGSLIKAGAGEMTLSGANTYTGVTTISGGTLVLGGSSALPASTQVSISTGSTLNLAGFSATIGSLSGGGNVALGAGSLTAGTSDASTVFSGIISGSGGFTKAGTGWLTLSGDHTYTGSTTITAGTLELGNGGTTGSLTTSSISNFGTFVINRSDDITFTTTVTGSGSFAKIGPGVLVLASANTYTGTTFVYVGTLQLGAANVLPNATNLAVYAGGTFHLADISTSIGSLSGDGDVMLGTATLTTGASNASTAFFGRINGAGGITKVGTGTFTLYNPVNYYGPTSILAGVLQLGTSNWFTDAQFEVAEGATFDVNGFVAQTGSLAGAGNINLGTGNGTLFARCAAGSTTFAGQIYGSGAFTKAGVGTLTLTGTSSIIGETSVREGGTLVVSGGTLSTSLLTVGNFRSASHLRINNGGVLETTAITRGSIIFRDRISTFTADNATLRMRGNTTELLSGFDNIISSTASGGLAVIETGGLTIDTNTFDAVMPGTLNGSGGLTKTGAGTLTLTAASTYTGATTVNAGTLSLASVMLADAAPVSIASGATLNLTHSSLDTVGALIIDGVPQVFGTWGAIGSGAEHETARITGPGSLLILSPSAFAAWTSMFGLTGPNALHSADPDADGALNLLEFYSGSSPVSAGPVATTLLKTPTGLDFTYSRAKGVTGVTAIVEWTDDLVTWSISGVSEPTVVTDQGATEIVKVTVPAGSGTGRFVRLRVTSP